MYMITVPDNSNNISKYIQNCEQKQVWSQRTKQFDHPRRVHYGQIRTLHSCYVMRTFHLLFLFSYDVLRL